MLLPRGPFPGQGRPPPTPQGTREPLSPESAQLLLHHFLCVGLISLTAAAGTGFRASFYLQLVRDTWGKRFGQTDAAQVPGALRQH